MTSAMGLVQRLKHITSARLDAFLAAAENPAQVLPQLILEMEEAVRETATAEAKAMASVKAAQRRVDEGAGRIERLRQGATLALRQGDEETTRDALAGQVDTEALLEGLVRALDTAKRAWEDAQATRIQLSGELDVLRAKADTLMARVDGVATEQRSAQARGSSRGRAAGLLGEVARIETQLDEVESEMRIQREIGRESRSSLDERLIRLTREAEIEKRMAVLRK
jgi:phage shock protein A